MSDAQRLAKLHTAEAIGVLVEVMRNPGAKAGERSSAANSLLDRAHGRAAVLVQDLRAKGNVAQQLAAASDDELLSILLEARRLRLGEGGAPPREGPMAGAEGEGSPSALALPLVQDALGTGTGLDALGTGTVREGLPKATGTVQTVKEPWD